MTTIIPGQIWLARRKAPTGYRRLLRIVTVDESGNGFVEGVSFWQQSHNTTRTWFDDTDPHASRKTRLRTSAVPTRYALLCDAIPDHPQTSTHEQRANADAGADTMSRAAEMLALMGERVTLDGAPIVALLRDLAEEAGAVGPNPYGVRLARRILGVPE